MIIGNSLNTYTLTIERIRRELELQKELIEAFVAIGANIKEALKIMQRQAVKAALIPVNNMLQTIGVVAIPGITTGMLLAGASPLKAVSYQIVIIYMLVSINLFSALFGSMFFIKQKVL
jgi:putative ABC transport system permease protein